MHFKTLISVWIVLLSILMPFPASAEMKIDSVYPNMGVMGEPLEVRIMGEGFDGNTRVTSAIDFGNRTRIIGSVDIPGSKKGMAIQGSYIYMANSENGLQVIDISDLENPRIISTLGITGQAADVAVSGDIAVVVGDQGHHIIDISDPFHPSLISYSDSTPSAVSVALNGLIAYIAGDFNSLYIVDLSNHNETILIKKIELTAYTMSAKVWIDGERLIVNTIDGLVFYNITNPISPVFEGDFYCISDPFESANIALLQNTAYCFDYNNILRIYDIQDLQNPKELGSTDLDLEWGFGMYDNIKVIGNRAFISSSHSFISDTLNIFDIEDAQHPFLIEHISSFQGISNLDLYTDNLLVIDGDGLKIVDISNLFYLNAIGQARVENNVISGKPEVKKVVLSDNMAYMVEKTIVYRIDISSPFHPEIKAVIYPYGDSIFCDIGISQNIAFVSTESFVGLHDINFTNLSDPLLDGFGTSSADDECSYILASGYNYYVASGEYGIEVFESDLLNWPYPINFSTDADIDTPGYAKNIAVSGQTGFVADGNEGLQIIDFENRKIIGSVDTPGDANNIAVSGNLAFIADGSEGLQIIDISNPEAPFIQSAVPTPGYVSTVYPLGDAVYVADGSGGIHMIDISSPQNPLIMASIHPPGNSNDIELSDNMIYTASEYIGLIILPVPVELEPITNTQELLRVYHPVPQIPGHYTLRTFNQSEYDELPGAVTFVPPEKSYLLDTKAIIVAGDKSDNRIRNETRLAADHAYDALLFQGYTAESIYYLTADAENEKRDGDASAANLITVLNNWTKEEPAASELLVFFAGHGEKEGSFIISDTDRISAAELDSLFDEVQNQLNIPLTFVYDACYSGTFLSPLTPPEGKERTVITGASNEEAYFLDGGRISFSYQFWDAVYIGEEIGRAFERGRDQMQAYQTAMIDANGNGIPNEAEDKTLADSSRIRRGYHPQTDIPYIHSVSEPQTIYDTATGTIETGVSYIQDGTEIQRVWAIITPPDFDPADDSIPVIDNDLKEIELRPAGGGKYSGTWAGFTKNGTYKITVCAMNRQGLYALFRNTTVTRESAYIISVSGGQVLSGQNTEAAVWAALNKKYESTVLTRVWAEIIPPNLNSPVMETDLSDPQNDGIYESMFTDFSEEGTYQIFFYAEDEKGYTSPAVSSYVTREGSGEYSDRFEPDDSYGLARFHLLGQLQSHNFHIYDDTDWCRFFLAGGVTYNLQILSDVNLCDTEVEIFQWDGTQPVPQDSVYANEDGLYWTSPEKGIYYIRVCNAFPEKFGQNITYDLEVYRPIAGSTGIIQGTLTDPQGRPVSEAQIFTDGGGSDLSRENGFFTIEHPLGTFILHVEADGFDMYEREVTINENETLIENIILSPTDVETGDVNGDGEISLKDALLALRISAGESEFSQAVCRYAHVNGDLRIGPEEAVYILQVISEMKP